MTTARITRNMITRSYRGNLNRNLSDLAGSNNRLSTQRSFSKASENMAGAARALRVRKALAANERTSASAKDLVGRLDTAGDQMATLSGMFQDLTDLTTRALNGTYSEDDRTIMANEIKNLAKEVYTIANSTYSGHYLFNSAGNADNSAPFSLDADGNLLYNGNTTIVDDMVELNGVPCDPTSGNPIKYNGTNYIDIGLGLTADETTGQFNPDTVVNGSLSGLDILGYGVDDAGLPKNIYSLLMRTGEDMANGDMDMVQKELLAIGEAHDRLLAQVANVGNAISFAESWQDQIAIEEITLKELQTEIEGIDIPEEIMYNQQFEMAWTVTLQTGAQLLPTSIFDFLR